MKITLTNNKIVIVNSLDEAKVLLTRYMKSGKSLAIKSIDDVSTSCTNGKNTPKNTVASPNIAPPNIIPNGLSANSGHQTIHIPKHKPKHPTSDNLKILWICNDNTANNPYNIRNAINKFTNNKCELIQGKTNYLNYPTDKTIMATSLREREFINMVKDADVVHINEAMVSGVYPPETRFKDGKRTNLFEIFTPNQKVFRHANGTYYRNNYVAINSIAAKHNIYMTVSTPELCYYGSNIFWLPQPIPLWQNKLYKFAPPKIEDKIFISHSPTNKLIKSTEKFLYSLKNHCDILKVKLIENMTHTECLNYRRSCHIHYDQCRLGAYGVSALEGLAIGQLVMVGIHNSRLFLNNHPFIEVEEKISSFQRSLRDALVILSDDETRHHHLNKSRKWIERIHSDEKVIKYLLNLYEHSGFWR